MKIIELHNAIESAFKKDGCVGIDKIIETENAWIFTPKRENNEVVYGDCAAVVFKGEENDAFLYTPEMQEKIGKEIKEVSISDLQKAS